MRISTGCAAMLAMLWVAGCGQGAGEGKALAANAQSEAVAYQVETVAEGLAFPWSVAFLPEGGMLVSERNGGLRVIGPDGVLRPEPIAGVPETFVDGQAGLFEVELDSNFAENQIVYLSYAAGTKKANGARVARARFDGQSLQDLQVIWQATPLKSTAAHYGGRMQFLPDGTLLITHGEGYDYKEQAQDLGSDHGKIVRIRTDGSIPQDNPFVGQPGARPEIFSYGHRNVQGIVRDPATGAIYAHEHGPKGGDELNLIRAGANYGWPVITYGVDYSGAIISPYKEKEGMEQPLTYWVPSIAPSGMTLYSGQTFPQWRGDLLISALAGSHVRRVDMENGAVVGQQELFAELGERIRDVAEAPDGSLILLTDADPGKVLRVTPKP